MADCDSKIPYGFCQCGCGQKTNIAKKTNKTKGYIEGQPRRFLHNHHTGGANNGNWQGGHVIHNGYPCTRMPDHPRAQPNGYVPDHILRAEKALGKSLPTGAHIHHHTPDQLVICEDNAYHKLLHQRQRAYEACGHAGWRKCYFCKTYDDPKNLFIQNKPRGNVYHRDCKAKWMREWHHAKKSNAPQAPAP